MAGIAHRPPVPVFQAGSVTSLREAVLKPPYPSERTGLQDEHSFMRPLQPAKTMIYLGNDYEKEIFTDEFQLLLRGSYLPRARSIPRLIQTDASLLRPIFFSTSPLLNQVSALYGSSERARS
jgi:hypothetical protein